MNGAAKGHKVRLCLPANASRERDRAAVAPGDTLSIVPSIAGGRR